MGSTDKLAPPSDTASQDLPPQEPGLSLPSFPVVRSPLGTHPPESEARQPDSVQGSRPGSAHVAWGVSPDIILSLTVSLESGRTWWGSGEGRLRKLQEGAC